MTAGGVVAFALVGAVLGAVLGSFAGVVAHRGWTGALRGRSRCGSCQRPLRWYELIPLGSYAVQRGRCRSCGSLIGRPTLIAELSGAGCGALIAAVIALALGHG